MTKKFGIGRYFLLAALAACVLFIGCDANANGGNNQSGETGPDRSVLFDLIEAAEDQVFGVIRSDSSAGIPENSFWAPAAEVDTFLAAIAAALAVYEDLHANQDELDIAVIILLDAMNDFQPQNGAGTGPDFASATTISDTGDKFTRIVELTFTAEVSAGSGDPKDGFTIRAAGTDSAIETAVIAADGLSITFTLTNNYFIGGSDTVTISYDRNTGSMVSADDPEARVLVFTNEPVTNTIDVMGPMVVGTELIYNGSSSSTTAVRVKFSEPVFSLNPLRFGILVNDIPSGTGTPLNGGMVRHGIEEITGSGDTWELTVATPLNYGEILRLRVDENAATDAYRNNAQAVPQLIIQNLLPRERGSFENTAGLYRNGELVESVSASGNTFLQRSLNHIRTLTRPGATTWTIVLGENQNLTPGTGSSQSGHAGGYLFRPGAGGNSAGNYTGERIIITTSGETDITVTAGATSNTFFMQVEAELTIIFDRHLVFKSLRLTAGDRGKIIIDGAKIMDNDIVDVGVLGLGGGSHASYAIMNSGELSGNTIITNSGDTGGSVVTFYNRGTFVMHGGTISGNTISSTGSTVRPRSGAIHARGFSETGAGLVDTGVFITGGEITNNTAQAGSTTAVASAHAVLVSGVFQKTGGNIHNNNATGFTGNIGGSEIVVLTSPPSGSNPPAENVVTFAANAGPEVQLFVDSVGGSYGVPSWLLSDWDD